MIINYDNDKLVGRGSEDLAQRGGWAELPSCSPRPVLGSHGSAGSLPGSARAGWGFSDVGRLCKAGRGREN